MDHEYIIKHEGNQWCVFDKTGEKRLGCHDTEAEAKEQLRVIEAAKARAMDDDTDTQVYETLADREIFSAGTWNNDKYDVKDLDNIVDAFSRVGFKPPVKLGHSTKAGEPAYGWVDNVRRVGKKLLADFVDVPDDVAKMVRDKRFGSVSAEMFWNMVRNGEKFPRVLKAVALLGSEVPAVSHLKPVYEFESVESEHAYTFTLDGGNDMSDKDQEKLQQELKAAQENAAKQEKALKEMQDKNDALAKKLEAAEKTKDGSAAELAQQLADTQDTLKTLKDQLDGQKEENRKARIQGKVEQLRVPGLRNEIAALYDLVTQDGAKEVQYTIADKTVPAPGEQVVDNLVKHINSATEALFKQFGTSGDLSRDDEPVQDKDAGKVVHDRTVRYMEEHDGTTYQDAMKKVLAADPELKAQYSKLN